MPGRRSMLSMSHLVESINDVVQKTKESAQHNLKNDSMTKKLTDLGIEVPLVDVEIKFIGASGLPKMDVVGFADPYFVAKLDDRITFVSNVISNTLAPIWNEVWRIRNVPSTASLKVDVLDKDEGSATDDYIGKFDISLHPGAKEVEIAGPLIALRKTRGTFWLTIDTKPSTMKQKDDFPYLFDGPIRFTRHFSPTVGLLTSGPASQSQARDTRLYSTWKINLKAVALYFRDVHQGWNTKYPAAQKIFGTRPTSLAVRSGIQAGHRMLYARLSSNGNGVIDNLNDGVEEPVPLNDVLNAGAPPEAADERIKPAVYTYIISSVDDTWRFSETGAAFFVDFASKHALHANCAPQVRYSGEFHPRPVGGWANFNDSIADEDVDWELVVDNNSGTYAPDKMVLPTVQECLEYNFGCGQAAQNSKGKRGFRVVVYDREDERLTESREACRSYAVNVRGVDKADLEPHLKDGEVSLIESASPKTQETFSADPPADPPAYAL